MASLQQQLTKIIEPIVCAMNYEFVGLQYLPQGKYSLLRIYIDKKDGITLDDCSMISHQISGVMDVEDIINNQYNLEISSPGLNRQLFTIKHYQQFIGKKVVIKFTAKVNNKQKITGIIKSVNGEDINILTDTKMWQITIEQIDNAHIVADF